MTSGGEPARLFSNSNYQLLGACPCEHRWFPEAKELELLTRSIRRHGESLRDTGHLEFWMKEGDSEST
ncbi:hypothetical protein ZWY2020_041653 [Hordeum vulgare]|nr:hypothetical protein ZWY2020_041653 [Hordeum vulgare]